MPPPRGLLAARSCSRSQDELTIGAQTASGEAIDEMTIDGRRRHRDADEKVVQKDVVHDESQ